VRTGLSTRSNSTITSALNGECAETNVRVEVDLIQRGPRTVVCLSGSLSSTLVGRTAWASEAHPSARNGVPVTEIPAWAFFVPRVLKSKVPPKIRRHPHSTQKALKLASEPAENLVCQRGPKEDHLTKRASRVLELVPAAAAAGEAAAG
jgi:hypothetical protein